VNPDGVQGHVRSSIFLQSSLTAPGMLPVLCQ
jgi:hypothetical protein